MVNTILAGTTEYTLPPFDSSVRMWHDPGHITLIDADGVAGDVRGWKQGGSFIQDNAIVKTASPSLRLTPFNGFTTKLTTIFGTGMIVPVNSGETVTVSVWVRESAIGDAGGVAYTGARPRLIARANPSVGLTADQIVDTATASADGAWEQLTGTVTKTGGGNFTRDGAIELYVDCDGTGNNNGWINVDDWSVS